ncbi:MAG: acetyltransferase [Bacteroidetes bacterium]|nr:MAG: acetyltransferase [Bacteroidota bacterium]
MWDDLSSFHKEIDLAMKEQYNRSLPFNEEFSDRWIRAKTLGFGEGTSIYDNSYVYGNAIVGKNCWIGPMTILDGSGGLEIGDGCTISAGVQIYSHDNVMQTLSGGSEEISRSNTSIGDNVYFGPNSLVTKGVTIGNNCLIGAFALVKSDIPDNSIVVGAPCRIIGEVTFEDERPILKYFNK